MVVDRQVLFRPLPERVILRSGFGVDWRVNLLVVRSIVHPKFEVEVMLSVAQMEKADQVEASWDFVPFGGHFRVRQRKSRPVRS